MARTQVQSELIATNAISGTIIADGAITSTHLAANSVDTAELVTGSIDTIHIAANQVTSAKIASNSILTRHIQDDQISGDQLTNNITIAGTLTSTGAFTSPGIDDNADAIAITIDSSENVGIGVVPETWHADWEVLQIGEKAAFYSQASGTTGIGENVYYDSGWKAIATAAGSLYQQDSGNHHFYTMASVSADATSSPSEKFTILNSGNVGINCTAPAVKFAVQHTNGQSGIEFSLGSSLNYLQSYDRNASDYIALKLDGEDLRFGTNDGTERMRIASNGNVGISEHLISSAVPTDARLHVSGGASGSGELENLRLAHLNTTTTGDGPSLHFHGKYNNAAWPFGSIATGNIGGGYGTYMDINIHPGDGTQNAADVTAVRIAGAANNSFSDARLSVLGKNYGATSTNTSNTTANEHPIFNIEGSKGARVATWVHGTDVGGSGATHNPAYSWYKFVMPGGYSDSGTSGFLEVTCYLTGKHASGAAVKQYKCMFVNAGGNATDDGGGDGAYIDEVYSVTRDVGSYTTSLTINWYYLDTGAGAAGATYYMKATTAAREPFFTVSAKYTGGHGHAKANHQYFSFLGTGVNNDHEPSDITALTIN